MLFAAAAAATVDNGAVSLVCLGLPLCGSRLQVWGRHGEGQGKIFFPVLLNDVPDLNLTLNTDRNQKYPLPLHH